LFKPLEAAAQTAFEAAGHRYRSSRLKRLPPKPPLRAVGRR